MRRRRNNRRDLDFLLNNKHYKRLHIALYFVSISIVVLTYFLTIILFSKFVNLILTTVVSFIVGLYVVINRDRLVKQISDKIEDWKREKIKESNKEGLETTLKKIAPKKRNISLKVNIPIKEKLKNFKLKKKNSKKRKGYIEVK